MKVIVEIFKHFLNSDTFQKGAALAYYAVFSLLPMMIIVISIFGFIWGESAVSGELVAQLKKTLGNEAAIQIQEIIKSHHTNHNGLITTIIGFATLALSATGMFSQVHNALNSIWNIKEKPKNNIIKYFTKHFFSLSVLIFLFFIILISTTLNSFLLKFSDELPAELQLIFIYEHILSFILTGLAFSVMFKFLGDAVLSWKISFLGGLVTSLLFLFGKIAIGLYIGHSHIDSTFGSASALAMLMLWVYYTSQIIFLGASFIEVISKRLGFEIAPNSNAVKVENVEV